MAAHGHWYQRLVRRFASVGIAAIFWLLATALSPLLVLGIGFVDLVRSGPSWARLRACASIYWVCSCELMGVGLAFWLWIEHLVFRNPDRFVERNAVLQRWWTGLLFRGAVRIFSMRLEIEGLEAAAPGPYLLLVRHTSTIDTVLAAALIANRHKILLRYILKKELLWDPCIDIVGGRLPNVFVSRGRGGKKEREMQAIASLADGLGADEGILIFPEGTRFTPEKQARAIERLEEKASPAILERGKRMQNVLPPRPGGPLVLLDAEPDLDVVILAHTGFEGARSLPSFWRGQLVGATIRVRCQRFASSEVPKGDEERLIWIYDRWLEVDEWISAQNTSASTAEPQQRSSGT